MERELVAVGEHLERAMVELRAASFVRPGPSSRTLSLSGGQPSFVSTKSLDVAKNCSSDLATYSVLICEVYTTAK